MLNIKNKKIANKFNLLLKEMADYYGLYVTEAKFASIDYVFNYIATDDIATGNATIKEEYKYLRPFMMVWQSEVETQFAIQCVTKDTFKEINDNIQKIRKEKLVAKDDWAKMFINN